MYSKDQWFNAKTEFIGMLERALVARNEAAASIKARCGQKLDVYELVGAFEFATSDPCNCCAYGRKATLAGIWSLENLKMEAHWEVTLSALAAEIEELSKWSRPEAWEAAWAAVQ